MAGRFASFEKETLRFLRELQRNNNREWFAANKARYEKHVLDVALRFIQSMQEPLADIAPHFTAIPRRSGGSLMRVYRDTRFARDKTPYKTNVGIQFRHEQGKDVHAPGFYVHIDPQRVFLGAGMWRPAAEPLREIRNSIVANPQKWQRARDDKTFRRYFELGGEALARAPRGFAADHALIEDLKRKDFIAVHDLSHDAVLQPRFQQRVETAFRAAEPFMRFLCSAVNVRY